MNHKFPVKTLAKKSFGQNFLTDPNYIMRIIDAVDPRPGETVVEIGPGRGALTVQLLERGANVLAVELERDMIAFLKAEFGDRPEFRLIEQDALRVEFSEFLDGDPVKLVANLPYNISTAILQRLIEQRALFSSMVLMFQKEVVDRITARPGEPDRGFLSVMTENYLIAEKLFEVPGRAFRPEPKVTSAITRLITSGNDGRDEFDQTIFRKLVSSGFAQRRKTIFNNLKSAPPDVRLMYADAAQLLEKAGIDGGRRAESLTLTEWRKLARCCGEV